MVRLEKQILSLVFVAFGGCFGAMGSVSSPVAAPSQKPEVQKYESFAAEDAVSAEEEALHAFAMDREYNFITVTDYGLDLTANSYLLFKTGTSNFEGDIEYQIVSEIATYLYDNPGLYIRVEGHTDADGDAQKNYDLSVERAEEVASWLRAYEVDGSRITVVGCGEWYPSVKAEKTKDDKMRNRRVEFVFVDSNGNSSTYESCMVGTNF